MSIGDNNEQNPPKKSKSERAALVILPIFGVLVLLIGLVRFSGAIKKPFSAQYIPFQTDEEKAIQEMADLRGKDTDHDGLSDYDELYVYHTSPYLADSDSDSFDDKQEIDSNNDPNCPKGRDCSQPKESGGISTADINALLGSAAPSSPAAPDSSGVVNLAPTSLAEVRAQLQKAGIPAEVLSKISDADLLQMYNETIAQMAASADANANTDANSPSPDDLNALLQQLGQ